MSKIIKFGHSGKSLDDLSRELTLAVIRGGFSHLPGGCYLEQEVFDNIEYFREEL